MIDLRDNTKVLEIFLEYFKENFHFILIKSKKKIKQDVYNGNNKIII